MNKTAWSDVVRGVAIGDAWGDPVEFQKIDAIVKRYGNHGPDIDKNMRITDDTQMTLYLAKALNRTWGMEQDKVTEEIIVQYLAYNRDPDNNRAPGITVTTALNSLGGSGSWKVSTSNHSDGSGTVMRTSPCAFLPEEIWVGVTALAAAITHGTPNGIAAAILDVAILRGLLNGTVEPGGLLDEAERMAEHPDWYGLTDVGTWLDGYEVDLFPGFDSLYHLIRIAKSKLPQLTESPWQGASSDPSLYIGGGGWRAHETLVIAMLSVDMLPDDPWGAVRRAIVSNGDSDTIGAVTGALVGAAYPGVFTAEWESGLRDAFEKRYVTEIEDDADWYIWNG